MSITMSSKSNTINRHASVIKTRRQANNFMQLHEADPQLPFSDLLLKDLTCGVNAIPNSAILDWVVSLLPDLIDFKESMIDSHRGYTNLKWMLQTSRYVDWVKDHKKQNEAIATHWPAPNLATQARLSMDQIASRMLSKPVPGDNGSVGAANLRWKKKMTHNLLLTVLMELQTSDDCYFQDVLGKSKAWKWQDDRRVQGMGGGEVNETAVMPTTRGPQPAKKRKRSRKGKLIKGIFPRVERRRKVEAHMSTNTYDTTFDDSHVQDHLSEYESDSLSDPEYDPRQDMSNDDEDAPPPAKRPKGSQGADMRPILRSVDGEVNEQERLPLSEAEGKKETDIQVGLSDQISLHSEEIETSDSNSELTPVEHTLPPYKTNGKEEMLLAIEDGEEVINMADPPPSYGASSRNDTGEQPRSAIKLHVDTNSNPELPGTEGLSTREGSGSSSTKIGQQLSEMKTNKTTTMESVNTEKGDLPVYSQSGNSMFNPLMTELKNRPAGKY